MTEKVIMIEKRDGLFEEFSPSKLLKVVTWARNDNSDLAQLLIDNLSIKIIDGMKITQIYDELITTAVNLITPIQRNWDSVAEKLLVMKFYKNFSLKTTGYYPDYRNIINDNLELGNYDKLIFNSFTEDELVELGSFIVPDNDLIFSYKGLYLMNEKYCFKGKKGVRSELPQHAYLRVAIHSFYMEDKSVRMKLIKDGYLSYSNHLITPATPRMLNSGRPTAQLASCVLNTIDDSTDNIMDTMKNLATYSKYSGGLALDVSKLRASGSPIAGNQGTSNGPVPFIKIVESVVSSFDQMGTRKGACIITYPFWHYDVMDMIPLNDAGGAEDNRARKLKYSMRIHELLKDRVLANKNITLFNPKDVPLLNTTYGKAFNEAYEAYELRNDIQKKVISARELMYAYLKGRKETGNIYSFFSDNVNEQGMVGDYVGASNLCHEITVSSKPSTNYKSLITKTEFDPTNPTRSNQEVIFDQKDSGEIGLCNLLSVNLLKWYDLSIEDKYSLITNTLRGSDNIIDYQFYPVKEGKVSNLRKRPIGIGVTNYAALLANNELLWTDEATKKFTHEVFEELYYIIYDCSSELAKERGSYYHGDYKRSQWYKGNTPVDISILNKLDRSDLNHEFKYDWELLRNKIKDYGVRFSLHGAVAPTACMSKDTDFLIYDNEDYITSTNLRDLLPKVGVDFNKIESMGVKRWYGFSEPIKIPTNLGDKVVNKVYYNGKVPTRIITTTDGNKYEFSLNHKLKVLLPNGQSVWKEVGQLTTDDELDEYYFSKMESKDMSNEDWSRYINDKTSMYLRLTKACLPINKSKLRKKYKVRFSEVVTKESLVDMINSEFTNESKYYFIKYIDKILLSHELSFVNGRDIHKTIRNKLRGKHWHNGSSTRSIIYYLRKGYYLDEATSLSKDAYNSYTPRRTEFWVNKGYTKEEAINIISMNASLGSPLNPQQWVKKGFTEDEAIKISKDYAKSASSKSPSNIKYWLDQGLSHEDAVDNVTKIVRTRSKGTMDYYLSRGLSESESKDKQLEFLKSISPLNPQKWTNDGFTISEAKELVSKYSRSRMSPSKISKSSKKFFNKLLPYLKSISNNITTPVLNNTEYKIIIPESYYLITNKKVFYADCHFELGNRKIIIEYDGKYWHNPTEDEYRDEILKSLGYEVYRFDHDTYRCASPDELVGILIDLGVK
jgi:ribonucleoside-diphosphate reductase alpha chain